MNYVAVFAPFDRRRCQRCRNSIRMWWTGGPCPCEPSCNGWGQSKDVQIFMLCKIAMPIQIHEGTILAVPWAKQEFVLQKLGWSICVVSSVQRKVRNTDIVEWSLLCIRVSSPCPLRNWLNWLNWIQVHIKQLVQQSPVPYGWLGHNASHPVSRL